MEPSQTTVSSKLEEILKFDYQCLKLPYLNNESGHLMKQSCGPSEIIYMVACAILSIFIVGANLTIIVVISRNKKLRNAQGIYKLSLACSDILVGMFVLPSVIITWTTDAAETVVWWYAFAMGAHSTTFMISLFTLVMASFDRLVAVSCPFKYRNTNPKRFALGITIALWILSFLSTLLIFIFERSVDYYISKSATFILIGGESIWIGLISVLIALMWSTSIAIFVMVRISSRNSSANSSSASRHESKLANTLGVMLGVFTVCVLPFLILMVYLLVSQHPGQNLLTVKEMNTLMSIEVTALFIFMSNSLWNCFVYSFRNKTFRDEVKKTMYSIRSTVVAIANRNYNSR